jgi:hypothetical protein
MKYLRPFLILGASALVLAGCGTTQISPAPETTPPLAVPAPTAAVEAAPAPLPDVTLTAAPADWQQQNHIHAMAVSPNNPEVLYLATHHGIIVRSPEGEWLQLGEDRADLMGFAMHPGDPMQLYRSGHPGAGHAAGGHNLGFEVSTDGGKTWQLRSMAGVDFHTLAISPSDPSVFYGLATSGEQGLFRSQDSGNTWEPLPTEELAAVPFQLTVALQNPDHVFATTQAGVFQSTDGGQSWNVLPSTAAAPITALVAAPEGEQSRLIGFQLSPQAQALVTSQDGGKSWAPLSNDIEGLVLHLAVAPNHPNILYAATEQNQVYQSGDGGLTWSRLN